MGKNKRYVHLQVLNQADGMIRPDNACLQFVVVNPSALVVKIAQRTAQTADYEFIIKANSVYVSPLFNFSELSFHVDAFAAGYVLPTVYCYDRWVGTPQISA